ncbi:hypothetical protein, partial [Komagataeibacter europaeus]
MTAHTAGFSAIVLGAGAAGLM